MNVVVCVHPAARIRFMVWRRNLPGPPADRDMLLPIYLQQIGRDAIAKTVGRSLPRDVVVRGPNNSRVEVRVEKIRKNSLQVTILDIT